MCWGTMSVPNSCTTQITIPERYKLKEYSVVELNTGSAQGNGQICTYQDHSDRCVGVNLGSLQNCLAGGQMDGYHFAAILPILENKL